jgi:hypothetical protein
MQARFHTIITNGRPFLIISMLHSKRTPCRVLNTVTYKPIKWASTQYEIVLNFTNVTHFPPVRRHGTTGHIHAETVVTLQDAAKLIQTQKKTYRPAHPQMCKCAGLRNRTPA